MPNPSIPDGWSYNPSEGSHRWPAGLLALFGCAVATYLTLFQVGVLSHVWEPFFGNGSNEILRQSSIAHLLPIPDAAVGALAYLSEAILDTIGGTQRWRQSPWIVVLLGLFGLGLGLTGIGLAISQPVLFHAFCTLCLTSAVCSILIAATVAPEVVATLQYLRHASNSGHSLWRTLWGLPDTSAAAGVAR